MLALRQYATKSDSLELCREASHCLSFIGEKNPKFIAEKILPQLTGDALQKDTFVLLLCQFVNLEGFMPLEICEKLLGLLGKQYDPKWNDSIKAAISGLKGMIPKINSGTQTYQYRLRSLCEQMVTNSLAYCLVILCSGVYR